MAHSERGPDFSSWHGRWSGKRQWGMDSLGNRYRKLPTGREKRGGGKTKGQRN